LLHSRGVYHADLHPENIIIQDNGQPCLIDVQEVFFLPWLPRWLRLYNLGKLYFHLCSEPHPQGWMTGFLDGYNESRDIPLTFYQLVRAADRHRQRRYRSRAKRCCKNSTEFVVIKGDKFQGYRRMDFHWGPQDLLQAIEKGRTLKEKRLLAFQGVCVKIHRRKLLHKDRCLTSWKMSRALEVRDIPVPRSLGYFKMDSNSYFLSEYLVDSILLNDYLSSLGAEQEKRRALKKLASWFREIHDHQIWQRDFKSSNVLRHNGDYLLVDLDGVRICRSLSSARRILNLSQLNASVSSAITIKDRLRFYYYYTQEESRPRRQRRAVYEKVWTITKSKNTAGFGLDIATLKP